MKTKYVLLINAIVFFVLLIIISSIIKSQNTKIIFLQEELYFEKINSQNIHNEKTNMEEDFKTTIDELIENEEEMMLEISELEEKVESLNNSRANVSSRSTIQSSSSSSSNNNDEITAVVTSYAPMCPEAVEGMDYSGDPSITASGQKVVPYQTAAGGYGYNIGDRVYIEGDGWWTINDRGGGLEYWQIDRAVASRSEALSWGRQTKTIKIERN